MFVHASRFLGRSVYEIRPGFGNRERKRSTLKGGTHSTVTRVGRGGSLAPGLIAVSGRRSCSITGDPGGISVLSIRPHRRDPGGRAAEGKHLIGDENKGSVCRNRPPSSGGDLPYSPGPKKLEGFCWRGVDCPRKGDCVPFWIFATPRGFLG